MSSLEVYVDPRCILCTYELCQCATVPCIDSCQPRSWRDPSRPHHHALLGSTKIKGHHYCVVTKFRGSPGLLQRLLSILNTGYPITYFIEIIRVRPTPCRATYTCNHNGCPYEEQTGSIAPLQCCFKGFFCFIFI